MAEAALRTDEGFDSTIVRRLMARPLRLVETPMAEVVTLHPGAAAPENRAQASEEVARLKAQLLVMKAVLRSERDEAAHLRACIATIADPEPLTPEAQAVRDRWAALVDQLLHTAR
ncbi:hypothetical protein [Methylobacterium sp. Leaf100]|uniref:hypothetical protein n=1 Tax=Methylobacterium sp. Leaf100 TaxID=1736252 RepID=UPI0006FC06A5|nr:hypothetical protein [Methylobacterium sp. Leaf100]KQP36485.1 hypothetical protein ASF25_00495 [Methylobacterium sp. Leaf100]